MEINYYFFAKLRNGDFQFFFFFLTTSLAVHCIYPTPQNKSLMEELHKNICKHMLKNMHYHNSVLMTSTILTNTLSAKRKNTKQTILSTASSEQPFHGNSVNALRGTHLSPLVSFAKMLHLQQLHPYLLFDT